MSNKYITDSDQKGLEEQALERMMQDTPESKANDFNMLSGVPNLEFGPSMNLETFDELMERDEKRKKDGLPGKLKIKKLVKDEKGTVIVVPYANEEKLVHDMFTPEQEGSGGETGGEGDGEEGEKTGEKPVDEEGDGEGEEAGEAGQGSGGEHGIEKDSYELGKYLSEKLKLPNLKDKGKKVPIPEPSYDMNDKTRRSGQFLNKKDTADAIVKSNILLGRVDPHNIDTTKLIVSPKDKVYNSLSEEKEYQSQAVVFFIRDYSGSMHGEPTKVVCNLHVMIYTWLIYQYSHRVIPRFIVHDTEAKEVQDFNEYFNSSVNGGTYISSAYKLMNDIIREENLDRDYNIFAFQGSDGDSWSEDNEGNNLINSLKETMEYCNRIGISIVRNSFRRNMESAFERELKSSDVFTQHDLIRLAVLTDSQDETLEKTIEYLVSED